MPSCMGSYVFIIQELTSKQSWGLHSEATVWLCTIKHEEQNSYVANCVYERVDHACQSLTSNVPTWIGSC